MRKLPLLLATVCLTALLASAWDIHEKWTGPKIMTISLGWHPDILPGYESRYVNQGIAFDGPCRSTIIRKLSKQAARRAILYVHGFNDYFFQSEMGERFVDSGYNFYAVDLRRYGRSKLPWQYPYDIRNQKEYFNDIDSALAQIRRDGNTDITLSGHSTGGLTVLLYAAERGRDIEVDRVVTNSPFLDWNYSAFMRKVAIPMVAGLSRILPESKVTQSHCDGYAESLLKEYHGQWTYDTDWKMIYSPPVTFQWIRSIDHAHSLLQKKRRDIAVPVLVMHSSRKISGCDWTPEFQTGDCVLDPAMIARIGNTLGSTREVATIDSGIHDLILSEPAPREATYDTIFTFLRKYADR